MPTPPGRSGPVRTAGERAAWWAEAHGSVLRWYAAHARPLPWREPGTTPWGVLVSEVMAQQTPVARVEPVWREWLHRWPEPAALAAAAPGEAVRAWGRLGYPRRALRLREAARAIVERHEGRVPRRIDDLRALPGVGDYTAAAVACFAFGEPVPVVDTNVRRVLTRLLLGREHAAPGLTAAERDLAASALPSAPAAAAVWNVAVMELGALVCTARAPRCPQCPVLGRCAWVAAGRPAHDGPPRRGQPWLGTDRHCRGTLLQVLREAPDPVDRSRLAAAWPDHPEQAARCLAALVAEGLAQPLPGDRFDLPGHPPVKTVAWNVPRTPPPSENGCLERSRGWRRPSDDRRARVESGPADTRGPGVEVAPAATGRGWRRGGRWLAPRVRRLPPECLRWRSTPRARHPRAARGSPPGCPAGPRA